MPENCTIERAILMFWKRGGGKWEGAQAGGGGWEKGVSPCLRQCVPPDQARLAGLYSPFPEKKFWKKVGNEEYDAVPYNVDYYDVQRFDDN